MSDRDVLFRLRIQELGTRISEAVERRSGNVTEAQIAAYYNRNRDQFAVPERRDLEIILTRTEAQANAAKRAIESGTSVGRRGQKILHRRALQGQRRQTRRRRQRSAGQSARHRRLRRQQRRHRRPGERSVRLVHRARHRHHAGETEHARGVESSDQRPAQTAGLDESADGLRQKIPGALGRRDELPHRLHDRAVLRQRAETENDVDRWRHRRHDAGQIVGLRLASSPAAAVRSSRSWELAGCLRTRQITTG